VLAPHLSEDLAQLLVLPPQAAEEFLDSLGVGSSIGVSRVGRQCAPWPVPASAPKLTGV
jgi:hypothetical protein